MPSLAPERYAVAGNPVEHSRSPFIHTRFAQQTGQALEYELLLCPLDDFAGAVQRFADSVDASGAHARGCNVTVPFKFSAFEIAPRHSERAALAQAANTLRFDAAAAGGWWADNTDGVGLVRDITLNAQVALAGRRILLIGAGGAAAGVLGELLRERPAQVVVANRSVDKAQALVARHAALAAASACELLSTSLPACGTAFDVVINGTATSLSGGGVPVAADVLRPGALALDMMYGPSAQGFMDWAAAHRAIGRDGLGMLVEQAAESFYLWRGVRPQTASVLAELRALLAPGR